VSREREAAHLQSDSQENKRYSTFSKGTPALNSRVGVCLRLELR
jgi:hypothetical protein